MIVDVEETPAIALALLKEILRLVKDRSTILALNLACI
jgi:hypothetical protein